MVTVTVTVPKLWDPATQGPGIVTEWYKTVGSKVKKDEIICLIMVAKVRVDVPSPVDGVITKIIANKGAEVKPGDSLAEIETT